MSFENDIKGQNTQLFPIVRIGNDLLESGFVQSFKYYSTNNVTIKNQFGVNETNATNEHCKPLLMNIPSIKESVDVESRKFKISNVSLEFNNFPFDGVRFSDQLSEASLINTEVSIWFKTPTTTLIPSGVVSPIYEFYLASGTMPPITFEIEDKSFLYRAYKGIIRRVSHDDEKVKIELEDSTEKNAHKDLPSEYVPDEPTVIEKYRGEAIPMVYGYVDRSPLVVKGINFVGDYDFQIDYKEIDNIVVTSHPFADRYSLNGFFIYDNIYAKIKDHQWEYLEGDNVITYPRKPLLPDEDKGLIDLEYIVEPDIVKSVKNEYPDILDEGLDYPNSGEFNISNLIDSNAKTYSSFYSDNFIDSGGVDFGEDFIDAMINFQFNNHYGGSPRLIDEDGNLKVKSGLLLKCLLWDYKTHSYGNIQLIASHEGQDALQNLTEPNSASWDFFTFNNIDAHNANDYSPFPYDIIDAEYTSNFTINGEPYTFLTLNGFVPSYLRLGIGSQHNDFISSGIEAEWRIFGVALYVEGTYEQKFDKKFYADVRGRINTFDDHPEPTFAVDDITTDENEASLIENPIDIIYDLVRSELGHGSVNYDEYTEAKEAHADWKFGFTVNKKINSKKLIEDIAKSTKCFPKFKNDGSFGFNTIKDSYTAPPEGNPENTDNDYAKATQIKESEVISYSFKKTKPEQIYRKVTVSYNKDYAQDSYLKTSSSEDLGADPYYGIELSSEAHLEFESDYIRDEATAVLLTEFLLQQYRNDHLIFNLKLPLQYINLEIGDLVKFRELFGGVKAYGIDYRVVDKPNEQYYYPLFMVTATTKNLDSVSVECMQLHHLLLGENTLPNGWGEVGINDDGTEGTFYFPDADQTIISIGDIEQFVETPPTITYPNGDAIQDIIIDTDDLPYIAYTPAVKAIDGDWEESDITEHITISSWGQTFNDGAVAHLIGEFSIPTQVLVTYSVESPTTEHSSLVEQTIQINVTNIVPSVSISPSADANIEIDGEGTLIHNVPFYGNFEANYLEKYVYNTSPDAEIGYSASDPNEGDLTNNIQFAGGGSLDYLQSNGAFGDLINPDPFAGAVLMIEGIGGIHLIHEPIFYSETIIAFVMDSGGMWAYKEWIVKVALPIAGDISYDYTLNVIDIVIMIAYITENIPMSDAEMFVLDLNEDGIVNVIDVVAVVYILLDGN